MVQKRNKQPAALLRFISAFDINPDNTIVSNVLDKEATFVSRFYTPNMKVSVLSTKVLKDLETKDILVVNRTLNPDSLTGQIINSSLRVRNPAIFQLAKTVILESFSLVYSINDSPELLEFIDADEIATARINVKYIIDALGKDPDYIKMSQNLSELDISLGYIQAQVPVLKGEAR